MLPHMSVAASYLAELTRRLRAVLGEALVGVYAGGSYALGEYVPGRSDLDVAVVVRGPIAPSLADALVAAVRHDALPCPARGLELVVYPLSVTSAPTAEAGFLLNLNTGAGMEFRADLDEAAAERHWFPIDRSILAQHGVALAGPPADAVFTALPRRELLPLLVASLVGTARRPRAPTTPSSTRPAPSATPATAPGRGRTTRGAGR